MLPPLKLRAPIYETHAAVRFRSHLQAFELSVPHTHLTHMHIMKLHMISELRVSNAKL